MESKTSLLPIAPSSLCFDKKEFMKHDFSVDKFVADCRRRVQLEALRQDLEVYFKLLKNAMIELINKDYADFVNLSSNLVGMDKAIGQLREPLLTMKDDMSQICLTMEEKITYVEDLLKNQRLFMSKRDKLSHMIKLLKSVEKIEQIQSSEDTNSGQVLERIAGEFNELQHHAGSCSSLPVLNQVRPRISEITGNLQQRLEQLLIQGVQSSDVGLLHKCLNSYALIGKTKDAEKLIQINVVRPYLQQILQEQRGDISQTGIESFFAKIIDFIPNYCRLLCDITAGRMSKVNEKYRGIAGYDFIVNSVWPEVVNTIESGLKAIYSPGYPDIFHSRYTLSMQFVANMEIQCGSQASVQRFRQSEDFARFHNHWSLPVYFQMRFQEIGGKLEQALENGPKESEAAPYKISCTAVLMSCIEMCWQDQIFLPPLVHRFWKVTLQCLSRYCKWAQEIVEFNIEENSATEKNACPISCIVGLSCDFSLLISHLSSFFEDTIKAIVVKTGFKDTTQLKMSLDHGFSKLGVLKKNIVENITTYLTNQSAVHLRYAQDVPRLFRRTNREAPTKSSLYVSNILKAIVSFHSDYKESMETELMISILTTCSSNLSERYFGVVYDVLTAVKKMEESLMRLQKMRAGKSAGNLSSMDDKKLSDDDKIRLQLYLDVAAFQTQLSNLDIDTSEITKLNELMSLVEDAKPDVAN